MSGRSAAGWAGGVGVMGLVLVAAAHAQPVPEHAQPTIAHGQAVLQGLDKVTARVSPVLAPIGEPVRFGSLEITARTCLETPPTEPPESAAFLEIRELPPDDVPADLFAGWMFASTPALSALEHPVYDIWVVDCEEPLEEDEAAGVPPAREG
jgi:hypothetical protein